MARDAIQAQLEATEARIQMMDTRITERLDRISASLESVAKSLDNFAIQAAQLNSGVNELKGITRQVLAAIEADREVAKLQSTNVQQMVALAAAQQQTINTLIQKLAA
jgi:archaellum component FlaC